MYGADNRCFVNINVGLENKMTGGSDRYPKSKDKTV